MSDSTSDAGWKDYPWMGFAYAELMARVARYGTVDGSGHNIHAHDTDGHVMNNPRILEYFTATSLDAKDESTSWCSAFANWCMKQAGIEGTKSALARSWLHWKGGVSLSDKPVTGAVAVFPRGSSPTRWLLKEKGRARLSGTAPGGFGGPERRPT